MPEDASPHIRCVRCERFVPLVAAILVGEERRPYCATCEAVRLGIMTDEEADEATSARQRNAEE